MDTRNNRKDSLFSGIFSPGEPAAAPPAPAQPAYRHEPAEDQAAALGKKLDMLERNLMGELERKFSERDSAPPSPPSTLAPALLTKVTEMENRLREFQEKFLFGAAQMRNMEESKADARREIGELLKAVREQQKYSELDRQMHDQLEKAWRRVEDMEKRLMEAYSEAAKRPAGPPERTAEITAGILKDLDARLEERFSRLEAALRAGAGRDAAPAAARGTEERAAELLARVDARLAEVSAELRQLRAEAAAGRERMERALEEVKKEAVASVLEAAGEDRAAVMRGVDAAVSAARERSDEAARALAGRVDALAAEIRAAGARTAELGGRLAADDGSILAAVSSMRAEFESSLRERLDSAAAAAAARNAGQLEAVREECRRSASMEGGMRLLMGRLSEIEAGLAGTLRGVKAFIKGLEPVNLEGLLGVSGVVARESFKTAGTLAAGLEKEAALLSRDKAELEAVLAALFPVRGGEEK